jgi:hypothetical protein
VRSRATIPIATAVLVAVGALVAAFGLRYYFAYRDLKFHPAAWSAARTHGYCVKSRRGRMVDDLVHNHLRPGMPMTRVRRLLGSPDDSSNGVWSYGVDREDEVFLPTCVYLELQTREGRLKHAEVGRDS